MRKRTLRALVLAFCMLCIAGLTCPTLTGCGAGGGGTDSHTTTITDVPGSSATGSGTSTTTSTSTTTTTDDSPEPPPATNTTATYTVFAANDTDPVQYYAEDGAPSTQQAYIASLQSLPQLSDDAMSVKVLEAAPAKDQRDVRIGCLWMDIRWEKHYIGECIRRDAWHLNFHIRDACKNIERFNLHVVFWYENGPQIGLYQSASPKWCKTTRGKFTEIKNAFLEALAIVGITGVTAAILADVGASATVAAFAL